MKISHIKKNAIHNVLGWLLPSIIFIILTPLMVKKLGVEGFGIVTLIQIITGYMTIMNFGFSEAIIKQIAENLDRNPEHAMRTMWAGLALFAGFGLLGSVTLFLLSDWLGMRVLSVPPELRADTVMAMKVGSLIFLLQMIAEFYRGCAIGCSRFDVPNISRVIRIALSAVLIVIALYHGGGLTAVMLATLAGLIVGLMINVIWMHRVLPISWAAHDYKAVFMELFHFSKHIFFVRIAGMISGKVSQFFLGTLSSVANVALYEVPTRAAETGSVMLNRILQVFYPGFSSMDKINEKEKIRGIVFSVLSIQLFIITPLMLMVILEGTTVITAWINREFAASSAGIITLIALTYFLSSLTNLPTFAAMSFNHPGLVSKYSLIRMTITVILVYPMVGHYGLVGAAWVLFLAELQAIPFIYETIKRIFDINIYRELRKPLLAHAAISITCYVAYEFIYRHSHLYTPWGILAVGLIYPLLALLFRTTSNDDNRRMKRLVTVWR